MGKKWSQECWKNLVTEWEWGQEGGWAGMERMKCFYQLKSDVLSWQVQPHAGSWREKGPPALLIDSKLQGRCKKVSKFNLHLSYCCYFNSVAKGHSIPFQIMKGCREKIREGTHKMETNQTKARFHAGWHQLASVRECLQWHTVAPFFLCPVTTMD